MSDLELHFENLKPIYQDRHFSSKVRQNRGRDEDIRDEGSARRIDRSKIQGMTQGDTDSCVSSAVSF